MLFNTPQFVLTLTAFLICWFLLPGKVRKPALLLFSWYFAYLLGGFWTVSVLVIVTLLTWLWGLWLTDGHAAKAKVFAFVTMLVLLLFYDKYIPFFTQLSENNSIRLPIVTMIGVSYYVLSAISYVVDIYRGTDKTDRNLLDIAVWIAFLPKFIAGPIERHSHFKPGLDGLSKSKFDPERFKRGLLICASGYFYKIIIADRIDLFVGSVYYNLNSQAGFTLFAAMMLYSLQIYFDFAGYSMIAYGIAYVIDLKVVKNFDHPFFAASVSEYWTRWHISLSSWLKDYIYIPLGGNRKGKLRQYVNLFLTFLVSSLWHGTGLQYVLWGALHGIFQIIERIFQNRVKLPKALKHIITVLAVSAINLLFRVDSPEKAGQFFRQMMYWNPEILWDGTLIEFSLDSADWIVLIIALAVALGSEFLQYRGISLYQKLQERNIAVRWLVYYLIIAVLLLFGKYGAGFNAADFIYYRF